MAFSLILYSPVLLASGQPHFVVDLTPNYRVAAEPMRARNWRHTIRGIGGYWDGEFTLYGKANDLARFFYEFLGYHLEEKSAGYKTWEGMIYEMELTTDGSTRRHTLDALFNHVRVRYHDTTNAVALTTAVTDAESIRRYGQRQQIWPFSGQDSAAAIEAGDAILKEFSWPRPRPTGTTLGTVGDSSLFVRACGYAFTANWLFESVGDNTDDTLSNWMSAIVTTDCPFLQVARIVTNSTTVRKETKLELRAWDVITKLLEMGLSNQPARAYVDNDRRFYYEQIKTTPVYFKRNGGFYTSPGANVEINPWQVRPGVVRDLDYPVKSSRIGSWLTDPRDYYMAEVEVWDDGTGKGKLVPKAEEYEEGEILTAQAAYKEQLLRLKERERRNV